LPLLPPAADHLDDAGLSGNYLTILCSSAGHGLAGRGD
jgi:hypothetical protein